MRKWMLILVAALGALACSRERERELALEPEGRVEVMFSVTGEQPATKALGEAPGLKTLHVAIFGSSGYLKEYLEAEKVSEGTYEYTFKDQNEQDQTETVPSYTYKVSIALSNSGRRVHFIGNGPSSIPFGRDYEILPGLLGEEETGFWQMVTLPNVTAKQDEDGNYVYNGQVRNPGDPYEPSAELQKAFTNIPLIRNWAKIELMSDDPSQSHFIPHSFAVVNVPKHGTLVPYGGTKGFITNYKDLSYEQLRSSEYNYGGNLPTGVEFDHDPPSAQDFVNCKNGVKSYSKDNPQDEEHTVYLYERPVPDVNMQPSFVIVYGEFFEENATSFNPGEGFMCYYKVDLMEGSKYYPVLRNFKYKIQIEKISARGHDTPEAAAAAAGSADVSADINASTLPDISDGTRRMAVQPYMSKAFIGSDAFKEQLYVVFYDDINGAHPAPNRNAESVTYELIPENAGIVKDPKIGAAFTDDPDAQNYGWRPVSFAVADPSEASARTQILRIKCKTHPEDENESPLYRDVVISLLPTQTMRVSCEHPRVLLVNGEEQRVDVAIPDGLVESMFPLHFLIEAKNLTLTPDNTVDGNNLPVVAQNGTFRYQRTLEWEEYKGLDTKLDYEDETLWRTFYSYFKTNCEESATEIEVTNDYFYTGSTSFTNYESFRDPHYTTSIPRRTGADVSVAAQLMTATQELKPVYLELKGLEPADGSGIQQNAEGEYYYTPTAQAMTFNFKTTVDDGDVSVTLTSRDYAYEPAVLTPWHFKDVKIMDMATPNGNTHFGNQSANVVYGHVNFRGAKQVLVGYFTDAGSPRPRTSFASLTGLKTSNMSWNDSGPISATGQELYRERWLETLAGPDPVSFTLSAVGYVEETASAPRFYGSIYTLDVANTTDWDKFAANGYFQREVSVSETTVKGILHFAISGDKEISSNGDRLVLPAGGKYELEASITSTNRDVFLFYAQIYYILDGSTPLKPRTVEPDPDGSIYYGYLGNNYEYMWNLPYGESAGKLVIEAPSTQDIVINRFIMRGFHGVLNGSGDAGGGDYGFDGGLNDGGAL